MKIACLLFVSLVFWLPESGAKVDPPFREPLSLPNWANDLSPITASEWTRDRARYVLDRVGFGGTPEDVDQLFKLGPSGAVDSLVDYERVPDGSIPDFEPSGIYPNGYKFGSLEEAVKDVLTTGKAFGVPATREGLLPFQPVLDEFYTLLMSEHAEMARAGLWWANRMLLTRRPLQERLTLFWHGHFATSQEKVANYELMTRQIATLRRLAHGNFRDLLIAIAQDPAMLIWLDNRDNVRARPNENFAREVLELFCLGEGQGYTETDIRELARAFTGWTLPPIRTTADKAEFREVPRLHDYDEKSFFGRRGHFGGEEAIDIILEQPATARTISRKLYREFVREELNPEFNEQLARELRTNSFAIKPFLKRLFLSRDFYSSKSVGSQIKPPVYFIVSTARKLGLNAIPTIPDFTETSTLLGQVLFYPPNVAGWPGGRTWINPATLFARGNYICHLFFDPEETFVPPDKLIPEGYSRIPELFPQFGIYPHLWNQDKRRMESVSLAQYHDFLAKAEGNVEGRMAIEYRSTSMSKSVGGTVGMGDDSSKMSRMAQSEWYNLAIGVYTGFIGAYNRVKPVPRFKTTVDCTAWLKSEHPTTVNAAVAYLSTRFLSVDLSPDRRASIVEFLRHELNSDTIDHQRPRLSDALLRTVHLLLSTPEYQVY